MGLGSIGKGLSSIGRHLGHAATSLVKGDVDKAIKYTGKTVNDVWNTIPLGQMVNSGIDKLSGGGTDGGVNEAVTDPIEKLETAKEESIKRRRALYATKGGALGAEVDKVGGTFGNNRGSLFGN
jgi:hypothetical protein